MLKFQTAPLSLFLLFANKAVNLNHKYSKAPIVLVVTAATVVVMVEAAVITVTTIKKVAMVVSLWLVVHSWQLLSQSQR